MPSWCDRGESPVRGGEGCPVARLALRHSTARREARRFRCADGHPMQRRPSGWRGRAGRQKFRQHITRHRLGTLAPAWPRTGTHGQPDGREKGRGAEASTEAAPLRQGRPARQTSTRRGWRMRTDGFQEILVPQTFLNLRRHAVAGIALPALRVPQIWATNFRSNAFGAGHGRGEPVAASDQACR